MPNVRFKQWVLLVAILVASGDAFGRSEPRLGQRARVATPSLAMFVRTADSQTAADPGGSEDGDEVLTSSIRQLQPVAMKCQTAALAPAKPETSSASLNRRPRRREMKYLRPAVVPDAVGALPPKSSPGAGGEETPTNPAITAGPGGRRCSPAAPAPVMTRYSGRGSVARPLQGDMARTAFEPFYSARNYAPLWITDGKANERAQAAMAYLAGVDADGLDPADYPVPDFTSLTDPAAIADAEVKLSARGYQLRAPRAGGTDSLDAG